MASEENLLVIINIYLGHFDRAFEEIEKDISAGKYYLNFYRDIPAFKLLAEDPRYSIFDTIFKSDGRSRLGNAPVNNDANKKVLLDENQIEKYSSQLLDCMAAVKPFLVADLSLHKLAKQLGLSPNQLSLVLNKGLGKNFNSFVSHYRVEEFKTIVKDPGCSHLTIVGSAYECGFNSKTVFNTYFKKQTGLIPRQFLKD